MKHLFIINPKAGLVSKNLGALLATLRAYFSFHTQYSYEIYTTQYPRDALIYVRQRVAQTTDDVRVYAVGGGGILLECLGGVMGLKNAELAFYPLGISNDFIHAFEHPEHFKSLQSQIDSPSILLDVMHCGSNYALNFCSIGMQTKALFDSNTLRNRLHLPTYLCRHIARAANTLTPSTMHQKYQLTIDGITTKGQYADMLIANGPYFGINMPIASSALLNDGLLDVLRIKGTSMIKSAQTLPDYLRGRYEKHPETILYNKATQISIRSDQPLQINMDGELFHDTYINLRVIPSAVRFISAGGRFVSPQKTPCASGKEDTP